MNLANVRLVVVRLSAQCGSKKHLRFFLTVENLARAMTSSQVSHILPPPFPSRQGDGLQANRKTRYMTDQEVEPFLGKPAMTRVRNVSSPFTGRLRANGDGTYSVDSGFGPSEHKDIVQRFTAADIESIRPL
jgi:hypothetical protein